MNGEKFFKANNTLEALLGTYDEKGEELCDLAAFWLFYKDPLTNHSKIRCQNVGYQNHRLKQKAHGLFQ